MRKHTARKTIMIPFLVIVLIALMANTAFALIQTHYLWPGWFYTVYSGYNTSQRNHVRSVQHITSLYPACEGISIDGVYGDATTDNVISFQTDKGLTVDGKTGSQTWKYLQYRLDIGYTSAGDDYYVINNDWSDLGTATSAVYFRHCDDTNGTWKYLVSPSNWGTIR